MSEVEVRFHKWWGELHWSFSLQRLGEDEHGLWLACPPGTQMYKGGELHTISEGGWVKVIPRDSPWTALFQRPDEDEDVYIDIIDGAVWRDDGIDMVDLDLDVLRKRDGKVQILDEDEFRDHAQRYHYPARLIDQTRAAAARIATAAENRVEPFDTVGPAWQERAFGTPDSTA